MQWEKIPLQVGDEWVVKEQLQDLKRQGIHFRFVREKQLDGKEILYIEKQVVG